MASTRVNAGTIAFEIGFSPEHSMILFQPRVFQYTSIVMVRWIWPLHLVTSPAYWGTAGQVDWCLRIRWRWRRGPDFNGNHKDDQCYTVMALMYLPRVRSVWKVIWGGLAQHLYVVSPTNLQLMPCAPGITLPPGDRGRVCRAEILQVVARGGPPGVLREKSIENHSGTIRGI